ncbi:hypothetical protein BDW68DRAFT_157096 [Aspergillus falconensis]
MSASPELKPLGTTSSTDADVETDQNVNAEEAVQPPTPGASDDDADAGDDDAKPAVDNDNDDDNTNQNENEGQDELSDNNLGDSDDESILSEVDEAQFEDFDPENVDIEDRPQLDIDEENLKLIGRHKRKRTEEEGTSKRKKEGRRKKSRRYAEDDDGGSDREAGGRRRKSKKAEHEEDEESLDPATRRRRALDRAMDEALKKPTKRRARKQDGIDLEQMADAEIEDMRKRMTHAAQMDAINRREGKPAMHKLKMLPEVVSLLNRNQYVNSLVDPEINLLEAVKFFLEPLDDGSLPAYNIQRDLMTALGKLPINKETLIASGIGKVVVFYTRSKRPEPGIKRMAERLLAEWTRPILQRSDDYSKRVYQEAEFDPTYVSSPLSCSSHVFAIDI